MYNNLMTITSIEQAKKREERVNIFLDDNFWVGLDKNQLIQFGLHKGKVITEEDKRHIEEESTFYKLLERVINYTLIRPRSKFEIFQYLTLKKDVDELTANKVIERVEEKGFLSDEKFAEWYIQTRTSHGFHGKNKISAELAKKGVSKSIVSQFIKENEDEEGTSEKIVKLYNKVKDKVKFTSEYERKNKIYQRIMGRGFTFAEIEKALKDESSL